MGSVYSVSRPKDTLNNRLKEHGYREVIEIVWWGETLWAHESSVHLSQKEIEDVIEPFTRDIPPFPRRKTGSSR